MPFEQALVEHAALTLAGLKPASLFRFLPGEDNNFIPAFLACREELGRQGLRLVILKGCRRTGSYLLCLYRERELADLLERTEYRQFLYSIGYRPWDGVRGCLRQLAVRLCLEEEFPHEIGVFLAIPWRMCRASSPMAAGTTPAAAAGSATATRRRPCGGLHATAAAPPSIAAVTLRARPWGSSP